MGALKQASIDLTPVNRAQRVAIKRKWDQDNQGMTYREFRRTALAGIGGDYIVIKWCGMWLGIEEDGYTHS